MPRGMRREDRRVVALLAFFHGAVHANVLAIPVFLLAWRNEFRADDVTLGMLASIAYAGYGAASVPFGFLADRRSPGRLLVLCGLGTAASLAGVALSPSIPALAVGLGTLGLFSGIYHPTGLSVISRTVADPGRGMGWHGMGGSLGIASGPAAVGAVLAFGGSWRLAAAALIVPSLIATALLLAGLLPPAGAEPSGATRGSLRRLFTIAYVRILLVYTFAGFAYQGGLTFLPRFMGAAAFAVALGLGAIGQILSGRLADRTHPDRILFGLSLVAAGILLALALLPTSGAFTVAGVAFGFLLFSPGAPPDTPLARGAPRALPGRALRVLFLSVFRVGSPAAFLAGC